MDISPSEQHIDFTKAEVNPKFAVAASYWRNSGNNTTCLGSMMLSKVCLRFLRIANCLLDPRRKALTSKFPMFQSHCGAQVMSWRFPCSTKRTPTTSLQWSPLKKCSHHQLHNPQRPPCNANCTETEWTNSTYCSVLCGLEQRLAM